jgi:hypothetical protein
MTMPPEIVTFAKTGGSLTKKISLDGASKLISDGSGCFMVRGSARRQPITNVGQLGTLIGAMNGHEALALGTLRPGLPDNVDIVTKRLLNGIGKPTGTPTSTIARTAENIVFPHGAPGFALLDFDSKGMPDAVRRRLAAAGGFGPALRTLLPGLAASAHLARASTSAGIFRTDTSQRLPGSDGVHVYVGVQDAADSGRFLRALHDRC